MSSVVPDWRILRDAGYFPPTDDAFGRPGFTTVLMAIHRQWGAGPQKIIDHGDRVYEALKRLGEQPASTVVTPVASPGSYMRKR